MNGDEPQLELLLATYNSSKYLKPLLESLLAQTEQEFSLLVSDDGSRDDTLRIIEDYAPRFRRPVKMLTRAAPSGSAMANFAFLLEHARAPYVMLVDHDDIWHADKIARGLAKVREIEARHGTAHPALAHGDLAVIDEMGQPTAASFWKMKQIAPRCSADLNRALMHATVVGCTVTANRALVKAALPVPKEAIMHDWWLNLVAAARGTVAYDPHPAIDYRIHGANASAPEAVSLGAAIQKRARVATLREKIARRMRQSAALAAHLASSEPGAAETAQRFASVQAHGWLARRIIVVHNRFLFPGLWRNFALLAAV